MALIGIILLIIVIFSFLVLTHEAGHFVMARRSGVEVEEFGLGFPPRIAGVRRGKTLYSINALPFGGFVRMKGENLTDTRPGTYGGASFGAKTRILFAGVTVNALTAFLILFGLALTGLPPLMAHQFSSGTPAYSQPKQVMVVDVLPSSPAAGAGLRRGDIILGSGGQKFSDEQDLLNFTKAHAGQTVRFQVSHHGNVRTVMPHLRPPQATNGYLGVTPFQTEKLKYDLPHAFVTAGGLTVQLVWATLTAFVGLVAGLFAHGTVSSNVAGPVGIVVLLKAVTNLGVAYVLIFVASIALSLAVINALPIPPLDGGGWALAAIQRLTRSRLSENLVGAVSFAGFAALVLLMLVVTFFDIKRLHP